MKTISVEMVERDLLGVARVWLFEYRKREYIEVKSAARSVQKTEDQLQRWLDANGYLVFDFIAWKDTPVRAVLINTFWEWVSYEADELDNPFAFQLYNRAVKFGLKTLLDEAESQGYGYIELPKELEVISCALKG
ncbi:hypothetical protein H6G17_05920 [Chroococcidiopsis sp. FACHB-1243]|uniref:hypothetical protein n=1 Tax=Chroococcidiopsis sp. [FACHB-1243] TaxID=2692781 RepID=UPI0017816237|nr:hypothetical protein [Chroococcidiopsis sp. [FACHB-1243]]MBD2305050.1 hypothetical protein [Chroococcidiopsis sp. [FACHB-1243]]